MKNEKFLLFVPKIVVFGRSDRDFSFCFPTCKSPLDSWLQISAFKTFTGGVEPWLKRDPVLKLKQIAFSQINKFENTPVSFKLHTNGIQIKTGDTVLSVLKRMKNAGALSSSLYRDVAKATGFRLKIDGNAITKYAWNLVTLEDPREFKICTSLAWIVNTLGNARIEADGTILGKKFAYCWDLSKNNELFKLVDVDSEFGKKCQAWSAGFFEPETAENSKRSYIVESELEFGKAYKLTCNPRKEFVYLGKTKLNSEALHTMQCLDPTGKRPSLKEIKDFFKGKAFIEDFSTDEEHLMFMEFEHAKKAISFQKHYFMNYEHCKMGYKAPSKLFKMFLNVQPSQALTEDEKEILAKKIASRPEFNEVDLDSLLEFKEWDEADRDDCRSVVFCRVSGFINTWDVGLSWHDIEKKYEKCILFSKTEESKIAIWMLDVQWKNSPEMSMDFKRVMFDESGNLCETGEIVSCFKKYESSSFWNSGAIDATFEKFANHVGNIVVPRMKFKNGKMPIMPFRLVMNPLVADLIWRDKPDLVAK